MEKSIILPLSFSPPIRAYNHHAFLLGILLCDSANIGWVMNNYIPLAYCPNEVCFFNFNTFPWDLFEMSGFKDNPFPLETNQFMEWIVQVLSQGKYIIAIVNEKYIPERKAYGKYDFKHDILVYGFEENNLLVMGYTINGEYKSTRVTINEFLMADPEELCLIKVREKIDATVDLAWLRKQMTEYLHPELTSKDIEFRERGIKYYGIEACRWLGEYLGSGTKKLDYRAFFVLYEHKKNMVFRCQYLSKELGVIFENETVENLYLIEKKAQILLVQTLKYNYSKNESILNKMRQGVEEINDLEEKTWQSLILQLGPYINENELTAHPRKLENLPMDDIISNPKYVFPLNKHSEGFVSNLPQIVPDEQFNGLTKNDGLYVRGDGNAFGLTDVILEDFVFESEMTIFLGTAISLVFGSNEKGTVLYCMNADLEQQCFKLWKKLKFGHIELQVVNYTIDPGVSYCLRIEVVKKEIRVFINKCLCIALEDDTLEPGKIGLNICDGEGRFQNTWYKKVE